MPFATFLAVLLASQQPTPQVTIPEASPITVTRTVTEADGCAIQLEGPLGHFRAFVDYSPCGPMLHIRSEKIEDIAASGQLDDVDPLLVLYMHKVGNGWVLTVSTEAVYTLHPYFEPYDGSLQLVLSD